MFKHNKVKLSALIIAIVVFGVIFSTLASTVLFGVFYKQSMFNSAYISSERSVSQTNETVSNYISSINIRVAMEHKGIADYVLPAIIDGDNVCHTLIISPPCCGKTTLLRDIIRQLSDGSRFLAGIDVGVVDERSEIAASHLGTAYNDVGSRTDILDCCPKEIGMLMLIRSMSPKVIAVDEIGGIKDIEAIRYVINSGCRIIATVHGRTLSEVINKPYLGELIKDSTFERIITIGNDYKKNIYVNKNGKIMQINKNVGWKTMLFCVILL